MFATFVRVLWHYTIMFCVIFDVFTKRNPRAVSTRRTVLCRRSRSDRPHYCVTTLIRAGHWPLTLTYNLDFQSEVSYGHGPHILKNQSSKAVWFKNEVETNGQTDRQMDATVSFTFPANVVGNDYQRAFC